MTSRRYLAKWCIVAIGAMTVSMAACAAAPAPTASQAAAAGQAQAATPHSPPLFSATHIEIVQDQGKDIIIGNLKNISGRTLKNVAITFDAFDQNDHPVGKVSASVVNLAPDAMWALRAEPATQLVFAKARIVNVQAN